MYTAISENYDTLKPLPERLAGAGDCTAFLDEATRSAQQAPRGWRVAGLLSRHHDPCRSAKYYKILSHRIFPGQAYSLWIDGSVRIEFDFAVEELVARYLRDHDLCIFDHPSRNCVYQEEEACRIQEKDDGNVMREQVERYRLRGYPAGAGMVEASVILRRHSPGVVRFNEAWWREVAAGSRRDQLSFNYCARRECLSYNTFPRTLRVDNGLFSRSRHRDELEN